MLPLGRVRDMAEQTVWTWGIFAIASGLGLGYSPIMPGTCGTLLGLPLFYAMTLCQKVSWGWAFFLLAGVFFMGVYVSGPAALLSKKKDPAFIVIDEIVGYGVAGLFLPFSWVHIGLVFLFFRVCDIVKPFPIRYSERLSGGWGIMVDDVIAGIYANILVRGVLFVMGWYA